MKHIKKILTLICSFVIMSSAFSQTILQVQRTPPSAMPTDQRLRIGLSMYIPQGNILTLNGAPDSTGMLFYNKADTLLYFRGQAPGGGNQWYAPLVSKQIGSHHYFGNPLGISANPDYTPMGAITKTDDSNVTLTLGGTPQYSVFSPVNFTLGWNGQLSVARGGLGLSNVAAGGIPYGSASGVYSILSPGSEGYVLRMAGGIPTWSPSPGGGSVNSVNAGNGMSFASITGVGNVVLGTPSNITLASTNSTAPGTHTHAFAPGGNDNQAILGNGVLSNPLGTSELMGRGTSGNVRNIVLGSNISMSGNTLNVTGLGTVNSIGAGNGMSFSAITNSGSVEMGTPSSITLASTNSTAPGTHTHSFAPGGTNNELILGNGVLSNSINPTDLIGRGTSGNVTNIEIGSGLQMTGNVLSATGGSGGGGITVNGGSLAGNLD